MAATKTAAVQTKLAVSLISERWTAVVVGMLAERPPPVRRVAPGGAGRLTEDADPDPSASGATTQSVIVPGEGRAHLRGLRFPSAGRAFDVREEEGHDAGGAVGYGRMVGSHAAHSSAITDMAAESERQANATWPGAT
jgi:hypothetical protein